MPTAPMPTAPSDSSLTGVLLEPFWQKAPTRRWWALGRDLLGFVAGFVIATITSPVGVSGAVFLLPFQLSVFGVPNPQVTPTNLLYNVLSGPGALIRYARRGQLRGPLARHLVVGSAPGVVIGAAAPENHRAGRVRRRDRGRHLRDRRWVDPRAD